MLKVELEKAQSYVGQKKASPVKGEGLEAFYKNKVNKMQE